MPTIIAIILCLYLQMPIAQAAGINEVSSCAMALKAFDSEDRDGIFEAGTTIKNVMQDLDDMHTKNGEPGALAALSDKGQKNPQKKLKDAAQKAYMELRAFQQSFR